MLQYYHPDLEDWTGYFEIQAAQSGHGMPVFMGMPYQRGGGIGNILGRLFRIILPIAGRSAKAVSKTAMTHGAAMLTDMASGQSLRDSARIRGKEAAAELAHKAGSYLRKGHGRKRRRPVKRRRIGATAAKKRRTGRKRRTTKRKTAIIRRKKPAGRRSSALFKNVQVY